MSKGHLFPCLGFGEFKTVCNVGGYIPAHWAQRRNKILIKNIMRFAIEWIAIISHMLFEYLYHGPLYLLTGYGRLND